MKKYRLIDLAKGKIRPEDQCGMVAGAKYDAEVVAAIKQIYAIAIA